MNRHESSPETIEWEATVSEFFPEPCPWSGEILGLMVDLDTCRIATKNMATALASSNIDEGFVEFVCMLRLVAISIDDALKRFNTLMGNEAFKTSVMGDPDRARRWKTSHGKLSDAATKITPHRNKMAGHADPGELRRVIAKGGCQIRGKFIFGNGPDQTIFPLAHLVLLNELDPATLAADGGQIQSSAEIEAFMGDCGHAYAALFNLLSIVLETHHRLFPWD
jgi:hypothetical protein